MDVHGPMQGADKGGLIGAQSFMSPVDGLCLPVGPVDVLLKQSHGEDVGDVLAENCRKQKASGKLTSREKNKNNTFNYWVN